MTVKADSGWHPSADYRGITDTITHDCYTVTPVSLSPVPQMLAYLSPVIQKPTSLSQALGNSGSGG